jgi:hypothetical protein
MKAKIIRGNKWMCFFLAILLFCSTQNAKAQIGPGGIGNNTTNVLWLRSNQGTSTTTNGSPISFWNDISGNGNNSLQLTGVNQPLYISSGMNGLPTVRFDGTNDYLSVADADNLDNTNGVSVFVVAQPIAPDALPRGIVSKRSGPGSEEAYYLFSYTGSNLYFNASTDRINGNDAVLAQPQVYSAVFNGSVANPRSRIYYNGLESGNGAGPVGIGNMASDLHIGILNPGYAQGFQGDISEVIVYRNSLNAAERSIVEAYLGNRYNITLGNSLYSSTTHRQGFTGIGHSEGEKYSNSQNLGSGLMLSERNNTLDEANEFVFAGHDGTAHGINDTNLPTIMGVTLSDRWQRIFYIERRQAGALNAGSTDIRLTFDFAGTGITLATDKVYYLLYRAGTSGDFSVVPGGTGVASEGKVSINLSNTNFTSGYYTVVKSDQEIRTWYSLNDGVWNNHNTWSLKPTEPDNPLSEIPGIMDRVVIQSNRTVTVTENSTQSGVLDVANGRIDFGTTTGNSFSTITGQTSGTIRLAADNFPSGDAIGFANASTGGTVEYYGANYELNTNRTFRNVYVNLNVPTNTIVLLANYTLNGSLSIARGEFFFGNSASTAARNLTIYENLDVSSNGKIRTGTANARHQLNVYGNFTNQGDVQFTNRVAANYTAEATDGIVDVNFRSATRNQTLLLDGPSRFYRIAIEKGTNSTYELYMEAENPSNFNLFGYANQGHPDVAQLASNQNAFGLAYGTVRVGPNITIARTNGGGNYNVSEGATLWVDGGTVTKPAGTGEAVVVYGKVKVSSGTFNSYAPSGITTRLNGEFESTGGITNLNQFRTSVYGAQHQGGYVQSGGYVTIFGASANNNYYSFSLTYTGNVFSHTGGTLHIQGTNSLGAIFVNSDPVNQNVSANATVILEATSTAPFKITSRAPFGSVQLNRSGAAGVRTFVLQGGTTGVSSSAPQSLNDLPLTTLGGLTLQSNVTFDPRMQEVTVGRSLVINTGAVYQAYSNSTNLNGTAANSLFFGDAGSTYFHNLNVLSGNYTITGAAGVTQVTIGNNLGISTGATLNDGSRTILVRGDITNSGTHTGTGKIQIAQRGRVHTINVTNGGNYTAVPTITIANPPVGGTTATAVPIFNGTPSVGTPLPIVKIAITNSGNGYIAVPAVSFSGGTAAATAVISTTHELGGNGNGVFGNLELNETTSTAQAGNEYSFLTANLTVSNQLSITEGILDLRINKIRLNGTLGSEVYTDYGNTRMLRTAGNHSDGGVERYVNANQLYLFPFGTKAPGGYAGNVNRYTPLRATFTNVTDDGYVQVNPVGSELGTLNPGDTNEKALQYYWRMRNSEFSSIPTVNNMFNYDERDVRTPPAEASYRIGKVIGVVRTNVGAITQAQDLMNYPNNILEEGEFTAGHQQRFLGSVQVFYLRQNGNWRTNATWSFTRGGGAATDYPKAGDIAVIRRVTAGSPVPYSGIVEITNAETCAKVIFDSEIGWSSGCPRIWFSNAASFGSNFSVVTVAETHQGGTLDGETHGAVIKYDLFEGYAGEFPIGDFGDFNQYPNSLVIYAKEGATATVTLSSAATEYPQVWFENSSTGGAKTFVLPDLHVTFNGMVIIPNHTLRMNTGANCGATFKKRLNIGHSFGAGYFEFAGNAIANQTVTCETNINLYNNGQLRINSAVAGSRSHKLSLMGNITMETGTVINLGDGNSANTNVELELTGTGTNSLIGAGTTTVTLSKLTINKGSNQTSTFTFNRNFSLNGPTNGTVTEKALQMLNGRLILNDAAININLSTGGGNFFIPSTSGLVVQAGTVNVSGADNGILLDGLLRVEPAGTINMDGGLGVNNFIEYSASGNATIEVTGGTLTVGSQIRRGTSSTAGILRYTQTGGNVTLGKNAAPIANRGVFEVLNEGSRFIHAGGNLTIVRPQTSATEATVLLEPAVSSVLGTTTLLLGDNTTPAGSIITLKSSVELGGLSILGTSGYTAMLKDRSLSLKRDLTLGAGNTFDGTGLFNLTVKRHIVNSGTANFNVDTLYLRGTSIAPSAAMQNITGNVRVKHLVIEPETSVTLQPASAVEVDGDMFIENGQLVDGGNTITVRGNLTNNASHASSNPLLGGLKFAGSALQRVYGTGQFGRIEVDNINGVQLENSLSLNNHLTLTNGILQLQSNKLTLGVNANILGTGFGDNKMIAVGGGDFLQGIQKTFPTVAAAIPANPYNENDPAYSYNFTFPIGVDNGTVKKYTPVDFHIAANSAAGWVNLYPVNRKHITFDATQTDVLQYYWIMNSSGISNFTSLIHTHYKNADVVGDEAAYIGARLFDDSWSKYLESKVPPLIEVVFENDDYVAYVFDGVNQVSGEYTAGIQPHIPDVVPLFISTKSGNWEDADTWVRDDGGLVPAGGPVGQRVRITTGHTVTVTQNFRRAYKTTINGRLDLGTTINHILGQIQVVGYVEGTGTLALQTSSLPAGNFDAFCNCGGGTLEFGGATGGGLPARTQFNNLTIAGSALWIMPNNDVNICGNLRMQGTTTLEMPGAVGYRVTTINGSIFIKDNSIWDLKASTRIRLRGNIQKDILARLKTNLSSTQYFWFEGTTTQTIDGDFSGLNGFGGLELRNPGIVSLINGQVDVAVYLLLQNQVRVQNSATSLLRLTRTQGNGLNTVNGVVEGPVSINMKDPGTVNKLLPVGKNNIKKFVSILDLPFAVGYWTGEYFSASPTSAGMPHTSMFAPIQTVSQSEYWRITGPNGVGSRIQLTLNGTSDVAAGVGNINNLRILYWTGPPNNRWEVAGGGSSVVGPISNGTITSGSFTFNGGVQYFTLGAEETVVIPTAQITSTSTTICAGETYNLTISLTGASPWQIQYSDGVTTTGWIAVNASPHVIPLTPATTTTYTLTAVRTTAGPVNGVVYGSPVTATVRPLPTVFTVGGGGFICNTETVSITLDDSEIGFTYELYRDGLLLGNQQAGTGNAINFTGVDVAGTYTIRAFNNLRPLCTLWMSGSAAVTVGSSAFAQITSVLSDNPACEGLPVQFEITFNGTPPFTFSMADNFGNTWNNVVVTLAQLSGVGPYTYTFTLPDQYPTWVAPALPNAYIFNVTNITDSSGCGLGSIGAGVTVNVYKLPETGPQYHIPNTFGE